MVGNDRDRRYWGIRVDEKYNQDILLEEILNGRLRVGWGYNDNQDLRYIYSEMEKGGDWWGCLDKDQKDVWRHHRMLSSFDDSVSIGDVVIVPNLPERGYFMIVEVVGESEYSPLDLDEEHQPHGIDRDYGHILPVKVLKGRVNKNSIHVPGAIRSTLKCQSRMWNIDHCADCIQKILESPDVELEEMISPTDKMEIVWESALEAALGNFSSALDNQINTHYQAEELESFVRSILEQYYPFAIIESVSGPSEVGADLVVKIPTPKGIGDWLIVVQVKNYQGIIDDMGAAMQLEQAIEHYSTQGHVIGAYIITTAMMVSDELKRAVSSLAREQGVSADVIVREDLLQICESGLRAAIYQPRLYAWSSE